MPVLVGRFTFYDSPYSWEYGLNVFREQGWSWTIWTHKVTGISSWGLYNLIDDFVRYIQDRQLRRNNDREYNDKIIALRIIGYMSLS